MWITIILFIITLVVYKIYQKCTCGICISNEKLHNKVAIVTGANTGIGFETAKDFAYRGAKVIIACRNEEKASAARDLIIQTTGNPKVIYKHLDLTSFSSVRAFAKDILETEKSLHVLVNNAGTGKLDNSLTKDNIPIEIQVNHFSPFLLTMLLLPLLKSSAPSRIVVVSSMMHWFGKVDLNNITKQAKNMFQHSRLYSDSKLCNILFTKGLSKRLKGTNVTINCLHPGLVNTDIFRNKSAVMRFLIRLFCKTSLEGAQTSIFLAVAREINGISGQYFADCEPAKLSRAAQDDIMVNKLWELSEDIVCLK